MTENSDVVQDKACIAANGTVIRIKSENLKAAEGQMSGFTKAQALQRAQERCQFSQDNKVRLYGECQ